MFPAKTTVKLIKGFRSLIQADNFKLGKWKSHPVVNFPAKILKLFGFLRIMEIEKIFIFPATKECWRHREHVYARHFIQGTLASPKENIGNG